MPVPPRGCQLPVTHSLPDPHARGIRSRQIAELADWVRQAEQGQGADIIAGDFNCTPDSEEYLQLTRLLGADAHPPESQPHFVTYDGCRSDVAAGHGVAMPRATGEVPFTGGATAGGAGLG